MCTVAWLKMDACRHLGNLGIQMINKAGEASGIAGNARKHFPVFQASTPLRECFGQLNRVPAPGELQLGLTYRAGPSDKCSCRRLWQPWRSCT